MTDFRSVQNFNYRQVSLIHHDRRNRYVGPPYCRAEMYAGRVACCPLVNDSESEYADGTDDGR